MALPALAVILLSSLAQGAAPPVAWSLLSAVVLLAFTLLVVRTFLGSFSWEIKRLTPIAATFFLVVLWAGVQGYGDIPARLAHPLWSDTEISAISADPGKTLHGFIRFILYGMVFAIFAIAATNRSLAGMIIRAIAIWSTGLALFGIWAFAVGQNPFLGEALTRDNAVQATFVNRNSYVLYAAFGAIVNVGVYLDSVSVRSRSASRRKRWRDSLERFFAGAWVFGLGALLCLTAVALTASRAGSVAAVLGLVTVLVAIRRRSATSGWAVLGGMAALIGFVAWSSASGLASRFLSEDGDARWLAYRAIFDGILDRPLLGHGLGSFNDVFRQYVPLDIARAEWTLAHSSYLENIFELGIPAAVVLYGILGLIGWRLIRGIQTRERDRVYVSVALGCYVAAMFHAAFDFSLQIPATVCLFMVILALGWTQSFSESQKRREAISG